MPEDTEAGQIQGFLEHYTGSMVCSVSCSRGAVTYDEPKTVAAAQYQRDHEHGGDGLKPFSNPGCSPDGRQRAGNGTFPATNCPTTKMDLWS